MASNEHSKQTKCKQTPRYRDQTDGSQSAGVVGAGEKEEGTQKSSMATPEGNDGGDRYTREKEG